MSERKVGTRRIAIALGALCIILLVGLVGAVPSHVTIVRNKDSQISDLQSQIASLDDILNFRKSVVWVNNQTVNQPANSFYEWIFHADYAGYLLVDIESSTTDNTYVRVLYSSGTGYVGAIYDNRIVVGALGKAEFPILPATIMIRVGNTNLENGATETVTITFYY